MFCCIMVFSGSLMMLVVCGRFSIIVVDWLSFMFSLLVLVLIRKVCVIGLVVVVILCSVKGEVLLLFYNFIFSVLGVLVVVLMWEIWFLGIEKIMLCGLFRVMCMIGVLVVNIWFGLVFMFVMIFVLLVMSWV